MFSMQSIRTSAKSLRWALVVLFAVVTLVQVPAMAVAYATAPARSVATAAPPDTHHHDAHSHRHHDHAAPTADGTAGGSLCQAMGCCVVAIGPAVIRAPAAPYFLLGLVDSPPARMMLPSQPEPADPPPRLQV